jgi:hypothetical protein
MADDKPPTYELYSKSRDSLEKFDYFICSVAGAIFAYVAQHYTPKVLAIDAATLEPVSLVLLAASFFCGIKRIELSGTIHNMDRYLTIYQHYQNAAETERLKPEYDRNRAKGRRLYLWRNRLLFAGFVAIFLAKVLQPYGADSSAHASASAQPAQIQPQIAHPAAAPIQTLPPALPSTTKGTSKGI